MSSILRDNPKWPDDLANELPAELSRIVNRCLRKDPERRFQTIKDAKIALDEIREDSKSGNLNAPVLKPRRTRKITLVVSAAAMLLAVCTLVAWLLLPAREHPQNTLRLRQLTNERGTTIHPVLSPDGKLFAYATDRSGDAGLDIWIQQLASGAAPIRLTRFAGDELWPSFSSDGNLIVFRSDRDGGGIYVMPALGGEERLVVRGNYVRPRFSPDG
jgi:hypothetical protein